MASAVVSLLGAVLLAGGCAEGGGGQELDLEGLDPEVLEAIEVVTNLQAANIGIMQAGPELGFDGRYEAIAAVATASFDIPVMARASYGPGFAELSDEQKRTWIDVFERFHVSSLADIRDRYRGQTYRILGYRIPSDNRIRVESILDFPGRVVDLYIDYTLDQGADGWRIIDVHSPPSVSEVGMRRAEYRTVLAKHGFDGLIDEMNARIERRIRP